MDVEGSDSLTPCHGVDIDVLAAGCELLADAFDGPASTPEVNTCENTTFQEEALPCCRSWYENSSDVKEHLHVYPFTFCYVSSVHNSYA